MSALVNFHFACLQDFASTPLHPQTKFQNGSNVRGGSVSIPNGHIILEPLRQLIGIPPRVWSNYTWIYMCLLAQQILLTNTEWYNKMCRQAYSLGLSIIFLLQMYADVTLRFPPLLFHFPAVRCLMLADVSNQQTREWNCCSEYEAHCTLSGWCQLIQLYF